MRKFADYGTGVFSGLSAVLFNFLIQIILIRLLGVASFGLFALWRNNVLLAASLGSFSMNTFALKRLSTLRINRELNAISVFRRNSTFVVLALSIVTGFITAIFLRPEAFGFFATVGTVISLALIFVWAAGNRALYGGLLVLFAERGLLPLIFLSIVALALVNVFEPDLNSLGGLFFGAVLLTLFVVFSLDRKTIDFDENQKNKSAPSGVLVAVPEQSPIYLLKDSLPFFFISLASFASARMPLILVAPIISPAQLGQLAFMLSLSGLVGVTLFSLNMVAAPKIASAHASGNHEDSHHVVNYVRWLAFFLASAAAIALWFLQPFFAWATDSSGLIVPQAFAIFLAASFLNVMLGVPTLYLQMTGHQTTLAKLVNFGVGLKIALVVPMIMQFGLVGVAGSEVIQFLALGVGVTFLYRKARSETLQ